MAKAVRRQTAAQRTATLFGGALLIILIAFAIFLFIQGNQRTVSDSPMQRLISAPVAKHFFAFETGHVEDGVMYVTGQFVGVPSVMPADAQKWQEHTTAVAEAIAKEMSGIKSVTSINLKQYYDGELKGEVTVPVK